MPTITITREVPAQFLLDVLTTAVEGGCYYWLAASSIKRTKDGSVRAIIAIRDASECKGTKFDLSDFKPGFERVEDITVDTVLRGVQRLFEPNVLPNRDDIRGYMLNFDAAEVDAEVADILVQLGLFGDVVFG